ncbi:MAG: copper resistance protein NlpE [Campylobacter sp.]|nr:copper resistance protein NlpE [Campylobacter sp.]
MKKILSLAMLIFLTACSNSKVEYVASLPCADCEAIESKLVLDNGKFILDEVYVGENSAFNESGEYTEKDGIITLKGNEERILNLKRIDGGLLLVGDDLSEPEENMRALYIYKKIEK